MKLEVEDHRYLDAAEGWLGLGNWREANEELASPFGCACCMPAKPKFGAM